MLPVEMGSLSFTVFISAPSWGGALVWGAKVDKKIIPLFPAFPFLFLQGQQNQQGQGSQHAHGALLILFYPPGVL